jgi:Uncharacterized protein conserved in bacteria C-term(DUF2220)
MKRVLEALAEKYETTPAGRTGVGARDLLIDAEKFLASLDARDGRRRAEIEQELEAAERAGVLRLERHPRDPAILLQVRLPLGSEPELYRRLGRPSPAELRAGLAAQFATAATDARVPAAWKLDWERWCRGMEAAAATGGPVVPFDRTPGAANAEILDLLPRLLAWEGESLVRFASCLLCGDSKRLESLATAEKEGELAGQLRGKLGRLLADITGGKLRSLDDVGILPNPRFALLHGPLRMRLDGQWLNLGLLNGPVRLALADIRRADPGDWECDARRCLTVENETTFHELAKLQSGELLLQTSFPGSATVALIRALPATLEWWHFGDSDPAGFEILRVLREKTGRDFRPLHMEPGRVPYEQESLGRPRRDWPFYGSVHSSLEAQ